MSFRLNLAQVTRVRRKVLQRWIFLLTRLRQKATGFSYDITRNGEAALLGALSAFDFRILFDVGSNIGDWTLCGLDSFPRANIYAFEIAEDTRSKFLDRVPANRTEILDYGLGARNGIVTYKHYLLQSALNTTSLRSGFTDHVHDYELRQADLRTGDWFCLDRGINFIDILKIDVEGSEMDVLNGFSSMLSRQRIRLIQFEYGYHNGDNYTLMRDFFEFLNAHGYLVARLSREGCTFRDWRYRDNDFDSGPNYIAIRRTDTVLRDRLRVF